MGRDIGNFSPLETYMMFLVLTKPLWIINYVYIIYRRGNIFQYHLIFMYENLESKMIRDRLARQNMDKFDSYLTFHICESINQKCRNLKKIVIRLIEESKWPSKHSIRDKGTDWTRLRALRILWEINHGKLTRNAGRNWCYILLVRVYFIFIFFCLVVFAEVALHCHIFFLSLERRELL